MSPLQNRVTPFGEIVAHEARGTIMGNRGTLCEEAGVLKRQWQTRRWIACVIDFGGRKRAVMQPRVWTALFFLDEATALGAGHRPCAYCRREDYKRFQAAWRTVYGEPADAETMDVRLDNDRRAGKAKRTYHARLAQIPSGAIVLHEGATWLVNGRELRRWSMEGYGERLRLREETSVEVLTPASIVAVIAAGYAPALHPSA